MIHISKRKPICNTGCDESGNIISVLDRKSVDSSGMLTNIGNTLSEKTHKKWYKENIYIEKYKWSKKECQYSEKTKFYDKYQERKNRIFWREL